MADKFQKNMQVLLSLQPPGIRERRLALAAVLVTGITFVAIVSVAARPLPRFELFLPMCQSALVLCDLMTAALISAQFSLSRSLDLLLLIGGYLFSAVMAILHGLSFPGLFSVHGLLGAGPQTTAWLYFFWHMGFTAAVIGYALLRNRQSGGVRELRHGGGIPLVIVAVLVLALTILLLTTQGHAWLPPIMQGDNDRPAKYVVAWGTLLLTLTALSLLWRRRRESILDLWLFVVMSAWACNIALAAVFNDGRFSLGWYAGRAFGLMAASFLLIMLIAESYRLYGRLAGAYAAEREQRYLAEASKQQLNALNEELEWRVQERTLQLETANQQLTRAKEELQDLGAVGARAREQERARLARDVHDEVGQLLVLIKDRVWDLEQSLPPGSTAQMAEVVRMRELIDLTLSAIKRVATDLRPDLLDVLGPVPAIESLVNQFNKHHGTECHLVIGEPAPALVEPVSTVVYRVIQEAMTNIAKHAEASKVEISLRQSGDDILLEVSDDGRGFDTSRARSPESFGIAGMRERVYMLSGNFDITSTPGEGTRIRVTLPLTPVSRAAG